MSSSIRRRFVATALVACALVAALPRSAEAQRRGPVRRGNAPVVFVGGTWGPRYVFYDPWFQWGAPYGPYGPYAPYGRGYYPMDVGASVRLDVSQRDAEVYVDGYRAGVVDDFDGMFQRLRVAPGGHEITVFLKGYRTVKESLYLSPGASRTLRYTMEQLGSGETSEPPPPPSVIPRDNRDPNGPPPDQRSERDRRLPPDRPQPEARQAVARFGSVSLQVQPADAEVVIDGEKWTATSGSATDRTIIKLSEGRHKIEVRKSGFTTYTETVLIRDGATLTLNVVLSKT